LKAIVAVLNLKVAALRAIVPILNSKVAVLGAIVAGSRAIAPVSD
jgi:hypothetical protein